MRVCRRAEVSDLWDSGTVRAMDLGAQDETAMAQLAARDLQQQFTEVNADDVDALVREFVQRRFEAARIKAFVGVLAERDARAEIKRQLRTHSVSA